MMVFGSSPTGSTLLEAEGNACRSDSIGPLSQLFSINIQRRQQERQPAVLHSFHASTSELVAGVDEWFEANTADDKNTIASCTGMVDMLGEQVDKSIVLLLHIVGQVERRRLWRSSYKSFDAWKKEIDFSGRIRSLYRQDKDLTDRQGSLSSRIANIAYKQPKDLFNGYVEVPEYLSENWLKALASAMDTVTIEDLDPFRAMARSIYQARLARDCVDGRSVIYFSKLRIDDLKELKSQWERRQRPAPAPGGERSDRHPAAGTDLVLSQAGVTGQEAQAEAPQARRAGRLSKRKRIHTAAVETQDSSSESAISIVSEDEEAVRTGRKKIARRELLLRRRGRLNLLASETQGQTPELYFTRPSLLLSQIDEGSDEGRAAFEDALRLFTEAIAKATEARALYPVV